MTRTDALNKVRWQFMASAAGHKMRFIVALWWQGYSVDEITEAMNFVRDWNTKAVSEAMRQVEQLIDTAKEFAA